MPDTDPIISDDDAAALFEIEDEIVKAERGVESAKAVWTDAKADLADTLDRRAKFTRGLKEKHPLFDMGGAGSEIEPVRLATNPQSATNRRA